MNIKIKWNSFLKNIDMSVSDDDIDYLKSLSKEDRDIAILTQLLDSYIEIDYKAIKQN